MWLEAKGHLTLPEPSWMATLKPVPAEGPVEVRYELPRDARERAAVASILGYGPGHSDEMVNDYLRTTRRARAVVDRVFWGD